MESEYGLEGLARLPLLEQVHRLHHAISMGYPYREQTQAWKTMPISDKRRLLQYIKDSRQATKVAPPKDMAGIAEDDDYDNDKPAPVVAEVSEEDPFLDAPTATAPSAPPADPVNDAYLAMIESRKANAGGKAPRWKIDKSNPAGQHVQPVQCPCGATHDTKDRDVVLDEIKLMMMVFGDHDNVCDATATYIQSRVKENFRRTLGPLEIVTLMELIDLFPDEATYYGRWKDFRTTAKAQDEAADAVADTITDEMVDEMDILASYENKEISMFDVYFMERIKFADVRTKLMESSAYLEFSKQRATNFMSQSQPFLAWLELPKCSRATLEFLNFIVYNRIGLFVEGAIRAAHHGQLQRVESPLMVSDIKATEPKETKGDSNSVPSKTPEKKRKADADDVATPQLVSPPGTRLKRLR
ncbi:hypothetical protein ACHHYP_05664 [Achlya hypogyna]|uniref:Uncharacterized protein n=1 Tax=Achlya hypogyna TaxID=1202772 RepID=A0A1V9YX45_ACHHY|nr:hypothetical protein ACHHYP_05664 [Achlya hypogyna]